MSGSWTGGRRRIKSAKPPAKQTLITTPLLFAKRDKHGKINNPTEWSEPMLRQASAAWEEVLIFIFSDYYPARAEHSAVAQAVGVDLIDFIGSLNLQNITVMISPPGPVETIVSFAKQCLIDRGARIKQVKNPREVTPLNLRQFVEAPHLVWASKDEHHKARIDLDKMKSFSDLQSERKKQAAW